MPRFFVCCSVAGCFLLAVVSTVCGQVESAAHPEPPHTQAVPQNTPERATDRPAASGTESVGKTVGTSGIDSEAIKEILRIRKEQGSPLDGTIFGGRSAGGSDPFADILREVARKAGTAKRPRGTVVHPVTHSARRLRRRTGAVASPSAQPDPSDDDGLDARLDIALRRAVMLLRQKANRLQERDRKDQADRLRVLAQEIRLLVRDLPDPVRPLGR